MGESGGENAKIFYENQAEILEIWIRPYLHKLVDVAKEILPRVRTWVTKKSRLQLNSVCTMQSE